MEVDRLTVRAQEVLQDALRDAELRGQAVGPAHLLLVLREKLPIDDLTSRATRRRIADGLSADGGFGMTDDAHSVMEAADDARVVLGDPFVGSEHILYGLARCGWLDEVAVLRFIESLRAKTRVVETPPRNPLDDLEHSLLLQMEQHLHRRVISQDDAVGVVSQSIRRAVAGLNDANRPFGSFLFLGPTGVGKTELAKALAEFLFGDERRMTRLDMAEYEERHTVSRLVGAPPGYVGHDAGGQLTNAVMENPYRVVLLDEMEKAHPDVLNVMLSVLDDGRLTSGRGELVDFTHTLVIMTSNVGSDLYRGSLPDAERKTAVLETLWSRFVPEFLNRIDEVVVFDPLERAHFHAIVDLQLEPVLTKIRVRGVDVTITDEAKAWLAEGGYNPVLGARQLRRFIQRKVQNPLAEHVLSGRFDDGGSVRIELSDDALRFV